MWLQTYVEMSQNDYISAEYPMHIKQYQWRDLSEIYLWQWEWISNWRQSTDYSDPTSGEQDWNSWADGFVLGQLPALATLRFLKPG